MAGRLLSVLIVCALTSVASAQTPSELRQQVREITADRSMSAEEVRDMLEGVLGDVDFVLEDLEEPEGFIVDAAFEARYAMTELLMLHFPGDPDFERWMRETHDWAKRSKNAYRVAQALQLESRGLRAAGRLEEARTQLEQALTTLGTRTPDIQLGKLTL